MNPHAWALTFGSITIPRRRRHRRLVPLRVGARGAGVVSVWKPGDVAMVRYGVRPVHEDITVRNGTNSGWSGPFVEIADADDYLHDARPLVVVDPEDIEQVERLWVVLRDARALQSRDDLIAALREYVRPTPHIEEPTGLGAVVEDGCGNLWVRVNGGWRREDNTGTWRSWAAVKAVRVLSHGVTPEEAS